MLRTPVIVCLMLFMLVSCTETDVKPDPTTSTDKTIEVDRTYRPLLQHFSSTGCGPCGRFGVPLLNQVAEEMGDTIVPLITHFKYNDPFIVDASNSITEAFVTAYHSPQIWVNNDEITFTVIYKDLQDAITYTKAELRKELSNEAGAYLGLKATKQDNGRYNIELKVENPLNSTESYFYEVYSMADGLVASQAGADPFVSTHYKVNRGGHFGGMGKEVSFNPGESITEEFEYVPCWVCNQDDLYFYAIVWKKLPNNKFEYVNGVVYKK